MDLQFKNIETDDVDKMMPFYMMRKNKTCDSVFLESFIWKDFYKVRYAIWEDKAILWIMEYGGKCFSAMPLCKEEDLPEAFKAIETYFNEELGYPLVINLADEYAVKYLNLPETEYFVQEQVDSKDYLYDGNAMRTLAGKKLHKKKNHVNSFMRTYGDRVEYRALCCSDSHLVWEFLDKWREQKGDEVEEHLDYEVKGIHDILKNCSNLNIRMGGVFIDGQIEAFTMGSYNPVENMAVIHIEKANPEIKGLYQYINQQFLLAEFPEVELVNREDDLGLEGLRHSKMSYNPVDFARKYLVEQIVDGKHDYKWAEEIGNTMGGEELVYLSGVEASETRKLWLDCFPEDTEQFLDYYYTEKVKDNQLLVKKQNGFLAAMAHLNPYRMQVKKSIWDIGYIVGVATEENRRHKGHMRDILNKMLNDMASGNVPFTFLMPADPAIYEPFDFTYIFNQPVFELKTSVKDKLARRECADEWEDCQAAAAYMERWLSARYEIYTKRDVDYVSRLIKELHSENGMLEFLLDGDKVIGLQAFWGTKKREQRLLYADERYTEEISGRKPAIMARITNVEQFLPAFTLREGVGESALELVLEDPLIEKNNGRFLWDFSAHGLGSDDENLKDEEWSKHTKNIEELEDAEEIMTAAEAGISLEELTGADSENSLTRERSDGDGLESIPVLKAGIRELASWLFGYEKPEQLWPDADEKLMKLLQSVDVAQGIFIDEVV